MSEALRQWLTKELDQRGLSHTKLANQIGLSHSFVSKVISGAKPPSINFCYKVAVALDVAPETVLHLAGLLPGQPAPTSLGPVTKEIMTIVEKLPIEHKHFILEFVRHVEALPPELLQEALRYIKFLSQRP